MEIPDLQALKTVERLYILATLKACKNDKVKTAEILKIARSTLWRRLKECGIDLTGTWKERNGKE